MAKTIKEWIKEVENKSSVELLINSNTGELWEVDHYALRERGYPKGGWMLFSDMSKADILMLLYEAKGWSI